MPRIYIVLVSDYISKIVITTRDSSPGKQPRYHSSQDRGDRIRHNGPGNRDVLGAGYAQVTGHDEISIKVCAVHSNRKIQEQIR